MTCVTKQLTRKPSVKFLGGEVCERKSEPSHGFLQRTVATAAFAEADTARLALPLPEEHVCLRSRFQVLGYRFQG